MARGRPLARAASSPSPPSTPFNAGELSPGPSVGTDEEILDWVARDAETALHPSCTCRMGVDELSVVDPETMRVHGVDGLRVVDASVFPYVTNGNIYAPAMMVAEKAADLILGATPLEPSEAPFYRHAATARRRGPGPQRPASAAYIDALRVRLPEPEVVALDVGARREPAHARHGHRVARLAAELLHPSRSRR